MEIITVPPKPEHIQIADRRWRLNVYALYFLATRSSPVRHEHEQRLAEYFDKAADSKYIRNTYRKNLTSAGLIHTKTITFLRGVYKIALVRLTDKGRELCRSFGWQVCENEWERLLSRHSGDSQPRHTAAVIVFSLSARMRGWQVSVLPETDLPHFQPDVLIEKDDQRMYVEVELGTRKKEKWLLYKKIQGYAVICGKTNESTETLMKECQQQQLRGIATHLDYLVYYRKDPNAPLFPVDWDEQEENKDEDLEDEDY